MLIKTGRLYQAFKYTIYALLGVNTFLFFIENFTGSAVTFRDGVSFGEIIVAYTDFIDTAAWLVLLLMLELETWVIPDEKLKGWIDWAISLVSFACYAVIVYAFYGYIGTLEVPMSFAPWTGGDPCALVGTGAAFAASLGEYPPLDAANCAALAGGAFYSAADNLFATPENLSLLKRLAWTDVLNAGLWLVIIAILELEIWLKSSKLFGTRFFFAYKSFKVLLYAVLFVNAAYWWMLDDPLAAWDAFLWLVAFFFIEMNVLTWQEENAGKRARGEIA